MNAKTKKPFNLTFSILAAAWTLLLVPAAYGESPRAIIGEGNNRYYQKNYDQALEKYLSDALPDKDNPIILYNQANAHYQLGQYDQAAPLYEKAAGKTDDSSLAAEARFNLGNTFYQQAQQLAAEKPDAALDKLNQSLDCYRQAMPHLANPDDARQNIAVNRELAQKVIELLEQQPPQQQNQNQNQDQDEKPDQDRQEQNQQPSQQDQPQQQDQQNQQDASGQDRQNQQQNQESQQASGQDKQPPEDQEQQAAAPEANEKDQPLSEKDQKYNAASILNQELQRQQQEQRRVRINSSQVDKDW